MKTLLNKKHKNGSVSISGDYMRYRQEGGKLSPWAWNQRIKEMRKEANNP